MCDYMYYEHKQRAKARNLLPEEPELEEKIVAEGEEEKEQAPMVIKA